MEAKAVSLGQLVRQEICYTLPLFQRKYVWEKAQWAKLWEDIEFLCEYENAADHFLGSVVCIQLPSIAGSVPEMMLIDGQQRLTTLFIILIVLRDYHKEQNSPEAQKINAWIINQYETGINKYKLQPTEKDWDRAVFFQLVENKLTDSKNQIYEAYQYFKKEIQKTNFELAIIMNAVISRLKLVSIGLSQEENPSLVFESLNSTGRKLYPSDLIRNYFFMLMPAAKQTEIYQSHWLPIESKFNDEELTEFIGHYLKRDSANLRMSNIYMELKARVKNEVLPAMEELGRFAGYYQRLLKPEFEPNTRIRYYLNRLRELETTTVYPFLLNCYDMIAQKELNETQFVEVLALLENYLIRRSVCDRQSKMLNKSISSLSRQAKEHSNKNFVAVVAESLSKRDYPSDADFLKSLTQRPMYGQARTNQRAKFLLYSLDRHLSKKGSIDYSPYSIEHIMPQNLDGAGWWAAHLGPDHKDIHKTLVHTLGNLTLTEYNSELSNRPFDEKKEYLNQAERILLCRPIINKKSWQQQDIIERGEYLANKCLEIWPYFGGAEEITEEFINTTPTKLTIKGEVLLEGKYSWADVFQSVCNYIYVYYRGFVPELIAAYPTRLSRESAKSLNSSHSKPVKIADDFYAHIKHLSAEDIFDYCKKFLAFVGIKETDWQVERIAKS